MEVIRVDLVIVPGDYRLDLEHRAVGPHHDPDGVVVVAVNVLVEYSGDVTELASFRNHLINPYSEP